MGTDISDFWEGGCERQYVEIFYMVVVQVVLLFVLETRFTTPRIGRNLEGFQNQVARSLTVKQPRRGVDGIWRYPLLTEVMEETGLEEAETYVTRRQNTVAQYIEIQPITDLCLEMERCRGARVYKRW